MPDAPSSTTPKGIYVCNRTRNPRECVNHSEVGLDDLYRLGPLPDAPIACYLLVAGHDGSALLSTTFGNF